MDSIQNQLQRLHIRREDVEESFIRSSGPGGQNVNKVETCVQLLHRRTGIKIKCQKYRFQHANRLEAWHMLAAAVEEKYTQELARLKHAREQKRRQNRRRSAGAKERMLEEKKRHAAKKRNRRGTCND